jgi:RNA polymerase sigma-70 factor (ECF subfamily)
VLRKTAVTDAEGAPLLPDDKTLIQLCKQGDRDAFDELMRRYEKRVFNFAYRMSGSYDDASDVTQEAFLRVFNSIGTFRGDAVFTTWLYRIVRNVFLDERKRAKTHLQTSLEEYIELDENSVAKQIEDDDPTPDQLIEGKERNQLLQDAIQSLPEYQRMMMILYHTQSKSYEEISQIMNLPIGTVKSRLNRARLALKEKLEPLRELFNL